MTAIELKLDRQEMRDLDDMLDKVPVMNKRAELKKALTLAGKAVIVKAKRSVPTLHNGSNAKRQRGIFRKALRVKTVAYDSGNITMVAGAPHLEAPHEWLVQHGHRKFVPIQRWEVGSGTLTRRGSKAKERKGQRVEGKPYVAMAADATRAEQVAALEAGLQKAIDGVMS